MNLVELDRRITGDHGAKLAGNPNPPWLDTAVWERWQWGTDPNETFHPDVMMNENHLLGLFLARYMATHFEAAGDQDLAKTLPPPMSLIEGKACDLTLRQLKATVQNLQYQWVRQKVYLQPGCDAFLDACMCRFGQLAHEGGGSDVMNDPGGVEDDVDGNFRMTRTTIRRFSTAFFVLYRHLFIEKNCVRDGSSLDEFQDCGIMQHHMQGGDDEFNELSMHWGLMPAAKLLYMHDFPGMYHSISQIVYFHSPEYVTIQMDLRPELANKGQLEPFQIIPAIRQLYPNIRLLYECFDASEFAKGGAYGFIVIAQLVYLVTPELRFYYHPNVTMLLKRFLELSGITTSIGPAASGA